MVGDAACEALLDSLSTNRTLQTLVLAGNRAAGKAGGALIKLLAKQDCKVTRLDVSNNELDDRAVTGLGASENEPPPETTKSRRPSLLTLLPSHSQSSTARTSP